MGRSWWTLISTNLFQSNSCSFTGHSLYVGQFNKPHRSFHNFFGPIVCYIFLCSFSFGTSWLAKCQHSPQHYLDPCIRNHLRFEILAVNPKFSFSYWSKMILQLSSYYLPKLCTEMPKLGPFFGKYLRNKVSKIKVVLPV